jgi:hypothetical protein
LTLFLLLATIAPLGPRRPAAGPADALLVASPVPLDARDPTRVRIGELMFLRGWELDSEEPRFGGVSALHVDSGRVTAISDDAMIFQFDLPGAPGSSRVRIVPLPRVVGSPKSSHDTEALVLHGASVWSAFELVNRVARFRRSDWSEQASAQPAPMRRWRSNSGAEGMVRMNDGRFLVFAEGRADELTPVVLLYGDPAEVGTRAVELRYRPPPGFRITDAALIPDGRLLLLNRRAGWLGRFSAKLVIADVRNLRAGAVIQGREIAELRSPLTVDNMEALSVTREDGRTIVRVASDNNFLAIQRTLLLEFALVEPARRSRPRRASSRSRASTGGP